MGRDFEEIELVVDDSFESLIKHAELSDAPAASFIKCRVYLNRKASDLLCDIRYVEVRKNDKYIVLLPAKFKSRFAYTLTQAKGCGLALCTTGGLSTGFYSNLIVGKVFKVKRIKSGGIAICLEEAVR